MNLSRATLHTVKNAEIPDENYFHLPEKVLQFGTGVLLRGLPDYFIDRANKQGVFNGRVVVIKSTGNDTHDFVNQDNLYTHRISGIEKGVAVERTIINASISRVLSASSQWEDILQCAANPDLQLIVSNTTEVGITLTDDDVHAEPPASFPGKLLALLLERYRVFNGAADKGWVIVPTELIPDNGKKLHDILQQLAHQNQLENDFIRWLDHSNRFCSSLVDRIVPGKPGADIKEKLQQETGVSDELAIISEPYALWAIESDNPVTNRVLSFSEVGDGVIIAPDIMIYRELKLRLLNGTHTFCCGLAYLMGFDAVKQAMEHPAFAGYVDRLMCDEISSTIIGPDIPATAAEKFAAQVIDRFRNPFIEHKWIGITLQYSSKMAMRNVPLLLKSFRRLGRVPDGMAKGFAAHVLFMNGSKQPDGKYYGDRNGRPYPINDDNAHLYAAAWQTGVVKETVNTILGLEQIWKTDLRLLNGFAEQVTSHLNELNNRP